MKEIFPGNHFAKVAALRNKSDERRSGGAVPMATRDQNRLRVAEAAPDQPQGVLPQNWGGTKQNHTVICMVLKAKANDKHTNLALHRDKFRRPLSDVTVDQIHVLLRVKRDSLKLPDSSKGSVNR
ncbi:hypothetical protein TNCV_1103221 [Trichonephila clavipes]|nr:hypothetical protein TNCV_1103221 [Trichonephila clavipes]